MKKICLFLIIIFLLVPVSSFASHVPSWPPANIPPNVELYEYVYVFYLEGVYRILSSDIPMMVWDYEIQRQAIFREESNTGEKRVIHHVYNANTDKWSVGETQYIIDVFGSGIIPIYYNDYNPENILYANSDIYLCERYKDDELDKYIFYPLDDLYVRNTLIDFWANVNIVQPREGYYDNIHAFAIGIITDFTRILTNDEIKDIKVDVLLNGVKVESFDVIYNKISNTTYYSTSEVQLLIDVPTGLNNVEIIYSYLDLELGRDNVNFTRLTGFIDEDGDGLDDRTGNTYVPERPIDPVVDIEKPEKPGEDGNAIDWLKYLGEYIGYIFEILINSISNFAKNVVSGVGSILSLAEPMFSFINQFFSSMPVEIRTAIIAMFSVSVFLVIMKMIRG